MLKEMSQTASKEFGQVPKNLRLHAIGGTATTIASQALGLTEYDSAKISGAEISLQILEEKAKEWLAMSVEDIAKLPCMPAGRADVLAGGAVLLATLLKAFGLQSFIASDRDNVEGYAIKLGLME